MLLMRRKGPEAPFALTTLILLFGKKKQSEERIAPSSQDDRKEAFPTPESLRKSVTGNDVSKARDRLRLASLERDIIGDALTKIYEAEAKGQINESEKNQLLQRYKTDLKISQIGPSFAIATETKTSETQVAQKTETTPSPTAASPTKERPAKEKPRNKAEERLETIREEVLKAMERLEQIETEG